MLDERVAFRLTTEELKLLKKKSELANLSQSDFLRQLIVDSTVHIIPIADDICLTFAYVYDALNTGTVENTKKAIERMDKLCVALSSLAKQSTATDL